jgi:hypothetical protein
MVDAMDASSQPEVAVEHQTETRLTTPTKSRIAARERQSGKVLVPALLYLAGAPLGLVLLLWFFFFRG